MRIGSFHVTEILGGVAAVAVVGVVVTQPVILFITFTIGMAIVRTFRWQRGPYRTSPKAGIIRATGPSRMVAVYADRFRQHLHPGEEIVEAGTAYNVAWAMEHGDSMRNGLLVIGKSRIFHCLDYGQITWEAAVASLFGVSTSKHPLPHTINLHVTFVGESGVHSQMTFYVHPRLAKSALRLIK